MGVKHLHQLVLFLHQELKSNTKLVFSVIIFVLRRTVHSCHQFFGEVTNQITNLKSFFSVSSHQNVLYNSVAIAGSKMFTATELYSTFW